MPEVVKMPEVGNGQAVAATFVFAVVVIAALSGAGLFLKGSVAVLFRDALRLVLVGYLLTSFLWGMVGFITTFITMTAVSGCQAAVAFVAVFDQLARILLQEFLFWSMDDKIQASIGVLLPQGFFLLRFILAGIFVGVQKPDFKPVCVGRTQIVPVAIILLAFDAAIITMLLVRAYTVGIFTDIRDKTPPWARSRSLLVITLALGVWTALSIPMLLGLESFDLVIRTVLPSIGLLIVIALVILFRGSIKNSLQKASKDPQMTEASARNFPPSNAESATRNLYFQSRDTSPSYPSNSSRPPAQDTPSSSGSERPFASREGLPIISRPNPGQAVAGVGGVLVRGQLFPPTRAQAAPGPAPKGFNERPTNKVTLKGGTVTISHPVLIEDDDTERQRTVPTVDLATAARLQKERRDITPQPPSSTLTSSAKTSSPEEMRNQPQGLKRKEVGMSAGSSVNGTRQLLQPIEELLPKGETSSAQTVSLADNVRRRSPTRQVPVPSFPSVPMPKSDELPDVGSSAIAPTPAEPQLPQESETQSQAAGDETQKRNSYTKASLRWSRLGAPISTTLNLPSKTQGKASALPEPLEGSEPSRKNTVSPKSARETLAGLSRNGAVVANIRPSRQRPNSPPSEERPQVPKTPVQLRQASGIPNNPKARILKSVALDQAASQGTVMFYQGPEKEDSSATRGIMDQALKNIAEAPPRVRSPERESIVNRPRPVPRKTALEYLSPARGVLKPPQIISSRILEAPEVDKSGSTTNLLPPKISGDVTPGAEAQAYPPDAPKEKRGLKQTSPPAPDVSSVAPPTLPTNENERVQPSGEKEASAAVRPAEAPSSDPRPRHSTGEFVSDFSPEATFISFDEQQIRSSELSLAISQPPQSPHADKKDKKRQSSPVIPADDGQSFLASPDWDVDEGTIALAEPQAAQSTSSKTMAESRTWLEPNDRRYTVQSALLTDDEDESKETMTVMLDLPAEPQVEPDEQEPAGSVPVRGSWHRRVGDKCPTFSDRKRMTRTRLVPRPPSLPLHEPTKTRKDDAAELLPLETPTRALEKIQEQLDQLGELVEQPAAEEGQHQSGLPLAQDDHQRGMSLLADLEMEMGEQEDHWQEMRRDYSRASVSSIASSADAGVSSEKLEHMLLAAAGVDSTGPDASTTMNLGDLSDPFSSPSDLEKWALGGDENLVPIRAPAIDPEKPTTSTSRPTSSAGVRPQVNTFLDDLCDRSADVVAPSPSREDLQRPVTRKSLEPRGSDAFSPLNQTRPTERPRTMRPPRRSKRMSSLPDILEDPVPIGGQRGNLGIFQFPWGETSNSASVPISSQLQAAMNLSMGMGMTDNMPPGMPPVFPTLDEQVRTLHSQDYPSSVFDDYDDNEAAGDEDGPSSDDDEYGPGAADDDDEDDDDDSFDETTLWEIANLLKSDKVPSRGSLFPEQERGTRQESSSRASQYRANVATVESRDSEPPEQSTSLPSNEESSSSQSTLAHLWGGKISHATTMTSIGLPQPEKTWETYLTRLPGTVRAPVRVLQPAALSSNTMWPLASEEPVSLSPCPTVSLWQSTVTLLSSRFAGPIDATDLKEQETFSETIPFSLDATPRWSQPRLVELVRYDLAPPDQTAAGLDHAPESTPVRVASREASPVLAGSEVLEGPRHSAAASFDGGAVMETNSGETCALWVPPVAANVEKPRGLFQMHQVGDRKGELSTEPAALKMRPNSRTTAQSLEKLESNRLWSLPSKYFVTYDWILLSSRRPSTSDAMSSSWGGRSPFTEASSPHSSITELSTASGSLDAGCLDDACLSFSSPSVHGDEEAEPLDQARLSQPAQPFSQPEWEAALAEALAASGSSPAVQLPDPPEEVSSESGSSSPSGCFDASTVHPVFLTSDLDTSIGEVHPAAMGY